MPGKMPRSNPPPSVRVIRGAGSGHTSRLSCKRARKTRTLMPVWDSSGESRVKGSYMTRERTSTPTCHPRVEPLLSMRRLPSALS
jgi:hypothetical protein